MLVASKNAIFSGIVLQTRFVWRMNVDKKQLKIVNIGDYFGIYAVNYFRYWQACFLQRETAVRVMARVMDDWELNPDNIMTDIIANFTANPENCRCRDF